MTYLMLPFRNGTSTKRSIPVFGILFIAWTLIQCKEKDIFLPPAAIASVSPKTGQPGTLVKIRGSNFGKKPSENVVMFNGVVAEVVNAYDTLLEVKAPASSGGKVEVSVRNEKLIGPEFRYYNLYCYGTSNYYAAYWKDGVSNILDSKGHIADLAVSGQDVHAVGVDYESYPFWPTYWKNGTRIELEGLTLLDELTGIAISGQDVYICGIQHLPSPGYSIVRYWKNGKHIFSSEIYDYVHAKVNDIEVVGNDVYMVGWEYPTAMLWKNGVAIPLSDGTRSTEATRVRVIDSSVHIMGAEIFGPYYDYPFVVSYWKDGVLTKIKDGILGYAMDFAISGSDIFVVGFDYKLHGQRTQIAIAKYWRNGVEETLSDGSANRYVDSIEITDDAIYVLTNQFGGSYPYYGVLLKNGTPITPNFGPGVTGSIAGMFVVYY